MKTVFTNDQAKHVWAQQTQAYGKASHGSLTFQGTTLYSYGTPIANFVTHKGKRACIITTLTYSVTTSGKHMPRVYDIPGVTVFNAVHIGVSGGRCPSLPDDWHKENVLRMAGEYEAELKKLARARDPENRERWLIGKRLDAEKYIRFFGVRLKLDKYFPEPTPEVIKAAKERANKQQAKKAAETRARVAAGIAKAGELIDQYAAGDLEAIGWGFDRLGPTKEQRERLFAIACEYWRSFKIKSMPRVAWGSSSMHAKDLLRVRVKDDDGVKIVAEQIETSRGAEFPTAHGLKALPIIRRVVKTGEAWQRNGHTIHLGHFQIDRIEADGTVTAGCHTVPLSEIEGVAAVLEGQVTHA